MPINRIPEPERPIYDARAHGAKCDECPLKDRRPVGPEVRSSRLVILGESPGEREDEEGRPFIGASGRRLNKILAQLGVARTATHVSNAVLCRPYHKMQPKVWDKALACCSPRLDKELEGEKKVVVAFGNKAFQYLTGKAQITNWMGAPTESIQGHVVVPSIHPAFALRKPAYIPLLKEFIRRARDIVAYKLQPWKWPKLVTKPPYGPYLKELLNAEAIAIDIENYPDTGRIRCIGVGDTKLAVSVAIPKPGESTAYDASADDLLALRAILSSAQTKVLHNSSFDLFELKAAGWEVRGPIYDTLLAHAIVAPQLPHDLSFVAASEFPAPRWKTEFKVIGEDKGKKASAFSGPLEKLLPYNAKDVVMTALLHGRLEHRIETVHRGRELLDEYHALNPIAMQMKGRGIQVCTDNLKNHKWSLGLLLADLATKFRNLVPDESFQLGVAGTHPSLGDLFFDRFKCNPVSFSEKTNEPSLDGKALISYVGQFANGAPLIAQTARIILAYRKMAKLKGSYVDTLPLDSENLVHPSWRIFGTRTGRWSATDPALQTIPRKLLYTLPDGYTFEVVLRDLFEARKGYVFVEADYKQLEARMVALMAKADKLLTWFNQGLDVYQMMAAEIFKTKHPTKDQRQLAKKVVHATNYGSSPETIWKAAIVEMPGLQLEAVRYTQARYLKTNPEVEAWQQKLILEAQETKFVEEKLSGRRQYYHDGVVVPTEVVNFPVQGAAGTLANWAVKRIAGALNWKDEALLAQIHDSTISEAPLNKLEKLKGIVKEAMEQEVSFGGAQVKFMVDLKVGTNWGYLE